MLFLSSKFNFPFISIGMHHVGTCKMGAQNDTTTVVDTECRVKGIKRLRVVDASV